MSFWTEKRLFVLDVMWRYSSAQQIADVLGCSRNAIIGKLWRLGYRLPKREFERRKHEWSGPLGPGRRDQR